MNRNKVNPERLLTWLDVERVLKQSTSLWTQLPAGVLAVDCYASGMEIRHAPGESVLVRCWLTEIFGRVFDSERFTIQLRIGSAAYPIELVLDQTSARPAVGQHYPLWRARVGMRTRRSSNACRVGSSGSARCWES